MSMNIGVGDLVEFIRPQAEGRRSHTWNVGDLAIVGRIDGDHMSTTASDLPMCVILLSAVRLVVKAKA